MTRVGGIILCGGQSKRMGRPKAWLPFGDELMLPRVARLLREAVEPVVVVAAPGQDLEHIPGDAETGAAKTGRSLPGGALDRFLRVAQLAFGPFFGIEMQPRFVRK